MATIKIDKQPNDKFTIRVWGKRDEFGKRKSKQIKNISSFTAAQRQAKQIAFQLDENSILNCDLTFNQLDDLYFNERKNKVSPTSLKNTFEYDRNVIRNIFGKLKITKINTHLVQNFIDARQAKNLKKKTVENNVAYLKAVINWGVNFDYIEKNNIKKLNYLDDTNPFEPTTLTIDQVANLLIYLKNEYYNLYIPTLITVLTSARRNEALGLTWEDIDFDNNVISFKKGLVDTKNGLVLKNKLKTKTSKRQVPLASFLKEELLAHKKLSAFDQVCSNIMLGIITPDYLTHGIHDVLLNIFNINMREHDLRHTFSQILYENEDLLLERSQMMGHSNTNITKNIYTKPTVSDHQRNLCNSLGEILKEQMCAKKCAKNS